MHVLSYLCAVQRADDEVDDAQVEALLVGVLGSAALLLLFNLAHQLFCLLILRECVRVCVCVCVSVYPSAS